ncbi:MAG: hypothetical protein NT116_01775 [Candidatus Parcubacteria bacterium]|nr:hypothetical protein [Candidatus Parcubacteria bacterium]
MPNKIEVYEVVVQKIIDNGRHGPYAVARSEELKSVTFSLKPHVWKEEEVPQPGICVLLSKVRKKRAGWRAESGRFLKPSDEQKAKRKEQGE